jgi:hypothetical protein
MQINLGCGGCALTEIPAVSIRDRLVLAEIARHDWGRYRCGCGNTAEHVADMFTTLVQASDPVEVRAIDFSGHLEANGGLFEVALPSVSVILAALAADVTDFAEVELIWLLESLVSGDSHYSEGLLGRPDLGEDCRALAREGVWVILRYVFGRNREEAGNILSIIEFDGPRRDYYNHFSSSARKPRH